jgi:branched-chain amino acid transport system substrate-binding protein
LRRVLLAAALAALGSACEMQAPAATDPTRASAAPTETGTVTGPQLLRVAYVADLSSDEVANSAFHGLYAVELAFAIAASARVDPMTVEVVPFDTQGTITVVQEIATEIANDAGFIAAFAAPNLGGVRGLVDILGAARVPVLSLSARGTVEGAAPGTWLRFVAPLDVQASAVADGVASMRRAREGICLVAGPSDGTRFSRSVEGELAAQRRVIEAKNAAEVSASGCGVVVWTGRGLGGAILALQLEHAGKDAVVLGGPSLREPDFLGEAGTAAEHAVSYCSCADVSTSLGLGAQRFIQDFQSEFGSAPGPYAVEAWDASHMLIVGLREAGPSRENLTAWLAATSRFDGLGASYAFEGGELADPESSIRRYRIEGGRWIDDPPRAE